MTPSGIEPATFRFVAQHLNHSHRGPSTLLVFVHTGCPTRYRTRNFFNNFEGTLAIPLTRSDAAWLFLMGISERESLPKQTTNHRRLESNHHRRNSGSDSGMYWLGFSKIWRVRFNPVWTQMATSSTLWCRHISYTMRYVCLKFCCNVLISVKIIKEMPGSVVSGTPYIRSVMGIRLTLFADDTSILIMGEDIQNLIFNLDTINWSILPSFDKNKLIINKDKWLAFSFHHKWNKHTVFPDIILKGRHITYVSKITFLGVWLDHYFKWDCHVENLIMKLSKLGFAIKTIKSFVNKNIVKTVYFAYLHSSLKYNVLIWGNSSNT